MGQQSQPSEGSGVIDEEDEEPMMVQTLRHKITPFIARFNPFNMSIEHQWFNHT